MSVAVAASAYRAGWHFQPPEQPTVSAEALAAAGLSAQPFTAHTIDVVRTSAKGKWHVPGDGPDRCPYLSRSYGYQTRPGTLPVQAVSVLGDCDFCRACAGRVELPGRAGVLYAAARWIVAGHRWVADLEHHATGMDWLGPSRWSAQTPFGPPDPIPDLLAGLAGARGFARHRLAAQDATAPPATIRRVGMRFALTRRPGRPHPSTGRARG